MKQTSETKTENRMVDLCAKCDDRLSYAPDPDDEPERAWMDEDGSSFCRADGYDHAPQVAALKEALEDLMQHVDNAPEPVVLAALAVLSRVKEDA